MEPNAAVSAGVVDAYFELLAGTFGSVGCHLFASGVYSLIRADGHGLQQLAKASSKLPQITEATFFDFDHAACPCG